MKVSEELCVLILHSELLRRVPVNDLMTNNENNVSKLSASQSVCIHAKVPVIDKTLIILRPECF